MTKQNGAFILLILLHGSAMELPDLTPWQCWKEKQNRSLFVYIQTDDERLKLLLSPLSRCVGGC